MFSALHKLIRAATRILVSAHTFIVRAFYHRNFAKITTEFLTEVAVLVLVFPTLDRIVEKGQSGVTRPLVIGSFAISLVCLFAAGVISMYDRDD